MRFVLAIQKKLGLTAYALAKKLGVTQQAVRIWNGSTKVSTQPTGMNLQALCKLRKLSGMSWSQFGRELDREFLKGDRLSDKDWPYTPDV
jgi:transcriptional regulator with XRE-family HTH domain